MSDYLAQAGRPNVFIEWLGMEDLRLDHLDRVHLDYHLRLGAVLQADCAVASDPLAHLFSLSSEAREGKMQE